MDKKELNRVAKKWVEALRSGKYKRGEGKLREGDYFCCLGVLTDIAVQEGVIQQFPDKCYLPLELKAWSGLNDTAGTYYRESRDDLSGLDSLASQNDHGKSFAEIADIIESMPEGLFS